jgi:2'-5' RNA ligase
MHRLFVAIELPAPVRGQLVGLMGGVGGARWQSEDQLHLTVRFIGEVDRHRAADVDAALAAIAHPPFDIALAGVGSFERHGEATTLWAALAPQEPLKTLHKKVDQAIVRVGLEPERRAYFPHVTLARLPRGVRGLSGFLECAAPAAGPPFRVDSFCLYESRLTPEGAVYAVAERYRLG